MSASRLPSLVRAHHQMAAARLRRGHKACCRGLGAQHKGCSRIGGSRHACGAAPVEEELPPGWQRVELRAFVHPSTTGGGNPVTAFVVPPSEPFPSLETRAKLAGTCDWESAFVQPSGRGGGEAGRMNFHVPSGPAMEMCAHAALGGAALLSVAAGPPNLSACKTQRKSRQEVVFRTCNDGGNLQRALVDSDDEGSSTWQASLELDASSYSQSGILTALSPDDDSISSSRGLEPMLHQLGLHLGDLAEEGQRLPMVNAGVMGRTKTMVPLRSAETVNRASAPSDPDTFRDWCDAAGGSTGVYLYAPASQSAGAAEFECRQFPRASGYPEDPATGVAAMALAMALQQGGHGSPDGCYGFYQGTAMGMASRIQVALQDKLVVCSGLVSRM